MIHHQRTLIILAAILSLLILTTCADIRVKQAQTQGAPSQAGQSEAASASNDPLQLKPLEAPQGDPAGGYVLSDEPDRSAAAALAARQSDFRIYNQLLALMGLPGLLPTGQGADGDYRGPQASGRLERNPDGSYGAQSSTLMDPRFEDIPDRVLSQAMSAGAGAVSTWAEGWFGGFGKAKVSVNPTLDGFVTGSIDFLSPLYDSERTTFFTQIGVRTMPGERIIGNLGLGQRWLWEDWAVGYNVFFDQDFTRGHMRGGVGMELWYDWLRLSANYYRPLSRWLPSKDYDSRYIQERPAEGFDARMTGYLPFYRNLSLSAAVERWDGEYVAPFGNSKVLARKPSAWVVGMGWTPIPILSIDAEARTYKDRTDGRVGLSFNYMFGVPLAEQLQSATVAELRTVEGSRHDFVQRQNEMVLEYRAIPGRYRLVLRKSGDSNTFTVTILDGLGNRVGGLPIKIAG